MPRRHDVISPSRRLGTDTTGHDVRTPLWMAHRKRNDRSHLLWTDDYLAAFAQAGEVGFVTLERACVDRYPAVRVVTPR